MDIERLDKLTISESIDFLNAFRGCNGYVPGGYPSNIWGASNNSGNIYNISGDGGAGAWYTAYYWLSTFIVNKWQRYLGRYLYITNAYAATAVNNLTILALGSGLKFQTPDEAKQKQIDEWSKKNKWRQRDTEAFKRYLTDGEVFFRCFGDTVRFVDPDLVYGNTNPKDTYCGVITEEDDIETPKAYVIHRQPNLAEQGEVVSASEVQHRANKHWGQLRGFSWLLPVASDLFQADATSLNLLKTSEILSKIAYWRIHKANQSSVENFRAKIHNQPQNQGIIGQNGYSTIPATGNVENIAPGSIFDLADTVDIKFPEALNGAEYAQIVDMALRKVSAHFHLPTGVFNDKSERGAYAAELVSSSFIVRSIEAIQEDWQEYNLQLLEMCGIDISDVTMECPTVAMIDKKMEAEVGDFLLRNELASKQTVSCIFDIDHDAEKELIQTEKSEAEELDNVNGENEDTRGVDGPDGRNDQRGDEPLPTDERQGGGTEEPERS